MNDDSCIVFDELKSFISQNKGDPTDAQLLKAISKIDTDHDDCIDWNELYVFYKNFN